MKVWLRLDVDEHARFVIARYFRPVDATKTRTRATRGQVRQFARAALYSAVCDQAETILDGRGKAVAQRLRGTETPEQETLTPPREQQRSLTW